MLNETPLIDAHRSAGGKLVDFGGWNMPLHYGSQIQEHHAVREDVGMFDVSHMTVVDVRGADAKTYLQKLLANDVDKLKAEGKALYSGMLNEQGGVIDDLIVYRLEGFYRLVVNCSTREKDLAWMEKQAQSFDVELSERSELAMIAVQGPNAERALSKVLAAAPLSEIAVFSSRQYDDYFIGRTGYTGEDGFEIILPAEKAEGLWASLLEAGVAPCGLGARDTLRLEAGMNLYGHEMDESISPLIANMAWTVAWQPQERNFIGRDVLEAQRGDGVKEKLVGLVMKGKGVLREGQEVIQAGSDEKGVITSGTFSPTFGVSIALARVPVGLEGSAHALVRGRELAVEIVGPCFIRKGEKQFQLND